MTTSPHPRLARDDIEGGRLLVSFFERDHPLAPGAERRIEARHDGAGGIATAHRLVVSPIYAASLRVLQLRLGVELLIPYSGSDGFSGVMFPPLPAASADRVAPWKNLRLCPGYPGLAWVLVVVNCGSVPTHVDAMLFGSTTDYGRR